MKKQLQSVYKIHCIDKKVSVLRSQLAELSASSEYKRKMESAENAVAATSSQLAKIEADLKDLELKLKSLETKQSASEKRFYDGSVTNSKELTAIEKDIQQMKQQKSKIDSDLLALYEAVTPLKAKLEKATSAVQVWKQRYEAAEKNESSQKQVLKKEYNELKKQRERAVAEITDNELISRYEAIAKRAGDTGAALVVDNRCEACHMAITRNIARALDTETSYEMCESCGRILLNSKSCSE